MISASAMSSQKKQQQIVIVLLTIFIVTGQAAQFYTLPKIHPGKFQHLASQLNLFTDLR